MHRKSFGITLIALYLPHALLYTIRQAYERDISFARKILISQAMNPLSLSTKTLLVACDDSEVSDSILGFGQIRPLGSASAYSELASLYVQPDFRSQGVGSSIVQALIDRHNQNEPQSQICLLTLRSTEVFYKKFGFREATDDERANLPTAFQFEYQTGTFLSVVLGNDLVCMIQGKV